MDATHTHTDATQAHGGAEDTAPPPLSATRLEPWYRRVEDLTEKLGDLTQRFGLSGTQRLLHSAHLEMEKLSGSAVYTLQRFLQASARLQPPHLHLQRERDKERVRKVNNNNNNNTSSEE
ncbi:hypothetical protein EYF80_067437 [Liparis tanakae]|uniref:Niban 1/2/3 domain-containing protein n=1 Tax=Liparis tanakae TaxID=230148 RepID=A0A4Z2E136_9TELE|nr:hypothetical protein EYF80_067437 [Liparis tanakae]